MDTRLEVPLKELFLEPENKGLQHIWKFGAADLCVYRNDKLVCIVEIGGGQHFDEKQARNDRRKWKLCDINGVKCVGFMNSALQKSSNRSIRKVLGSRIFW